MLRHGETVGQSSIRLYGATDLALAPEGELQVREAGRVLTGERYDLVLTSPLIRARRSAELVLEAIRHPQISVEIVDDFREIDFGAWEGWTWDEIRERDPDNHARFRSEGLEFCFPQGESRRAFLARVQAAAELSIAAAFANGAQRILTVVHKGVIKAICAHLLGVELASLSRLDLSLGGVHRLRREPTSWTMSLGSS